MLPRSLAASLVADGSGPRGLRVKPQGKREEVEVNYTANPVGPTRDRRDGVFVRAASPGDRDRLRRMFSRLSRRSIYQRFHLPYPRVPEWAVALFTGAGDYGGESLVAVAGGEILGHAVYVRSEYGHDAEMAVLVEDGWQSKGIGRLLVSELARRVAGRGIETFTAEVLAENQRALGLLTAVFAGTRYAMRDGVYHVRMPLLAPKPTGNPAEAVGRAA